MQLPQRTINANSRIVVTRLLPEPGQVLVQAGQKVEALQVIARTELSARYRVLDVARQLARPRIDMDQVMRKQVGETVEANEVIAADKGGMSFFRRFVRTPVAGCIAAIGPGWVLLETERSMLELQAFINGVVTRVVPERGVVIEASGAMITAACGFGGEAYGPLKRLVNGPFESLEPDAFDENVKNSILLGGRTVDETILRVAEEAHVRGIIVGSLDASLLNLEPPVKVRVVATEGFGQGLMSPYTFGILGTLDRREISIRGSTPTLFPMTAQGVWTEPPLILATTSGRQSSSPSAPSKSEKHEIVVGSRVRVTRGQLLGTSGLIESLPSEPQTTGMGLVAPGAYVRLNDAVHFIPWANLEQVN